MSFNWFKRMFGAEPVQRHQHVSQSANAKVIEKPEASTDSSKTARSEKQIPQKLYEEYVGLLDQAFCAAVYNDPSEVPEFTSERDARAVREASRIVSQASLSFDKLPRRPNALPMVLKLLKLDKLQYKDISDALLQDPALTSQVLKTANSPFFRVNEKTVESLDQAIFLLGIDGIKKVVAAAIMKPLFQSDRTDNKVNEAIWSWALLSGQALDAIAERKNQGEGSLYLLGLLPALSMLLINRLIDEFEAPRNELERLTPYYRVQVFRRNAHALSCEIREEWGLPESYDQQLLSLDCSTVFSEKSLLLDALYIAQYALVDQKVGSPLNLQQLTALTSTSKDENLELLTLLRGRNEAAPG